MYNIKSAINVDELMGIQNFEFRRVSTRQGRSHVDIIGCKIRGLRNPYRNRTQDPVPNAGTLHDDGMRELKIFGCEYNFHLKYFH